MLLKQQGFKNQLDQYELNSRPLQRGNLCTVIRAKHRVTGAEVAVKAIDKTRLDEISSS